MSTPLEAELQQHAGALRALARLLVGERHADDLVQDVALAALQSPPVEPTGMKAWLQLVLRRQASNRRRAEARRQRREDAAAAVRSGTAASPVAGLEQQEAVRSVTAALFALPEAYRDVLFRRFFQDCTPSAIAADTGVPLATVKSRLQRGLALLRERLDAGPKRDWRQGLVAAFGLEETGLVGSTSTIGGLLLMGIGAKSLLFVTAAAVLSLWLALGAREPAPTPGATDLVAVEAGVAPTEAAPGERTAAPSSPAAAAAAAATAASAAPASIVGRCVDERGQPLAGVVVRVDSRVAAARLDAWTRRHDDPVPATWQVTTAIDGRFRFAFEPLPPLDYAIEVRHPAFITLAGTISSFEPGQCADLGDVVLQRGTHLFGRLVDREGRPQAGVAVDLIFDGDWEGRLQPSFGTDWVTGADGTFDAPDRLAAGSYTIHGAGLRGVVPERLELDGRIAELPLELSVEAVDVPMSLGGVVVDELGRPVPDVVVRYRDPIGGRTHFVRTDAAGRFTLVRRPRLPDALLLEVVGDGYESTTTAAPVAFGDRDVRLVVRSGIAVEVHVTAAADGGAVEGWQLRLLHVAGGNVVRSEVGLRGRHQGGRARLDRLARGDYLAIVEPRSEAFALGAPVALRVDDPGPVRLEVRLAAEGERRVEVRDVDGAPVVGASVHVAVPLAGSLTATTRRFAADAFGHAIADGALQLGTFVTDAAGVVLARGPVGGGAGLVVTGPAHLPTCVPSVDFASPTPLVVVVDRGAGLRGRLQPLAKWQRCCEAAAAGPAPQVVLLPAGPEQSRLLAERGQEIGVTAEGTFAIDGLLPGTWRLGLSWSAGSGGAASRHVTPIGSVLLGEGMSVAATFDIDWFDAVRLRGSVRKNGEPLRATDIDLDGELGPEFGVDDTWVTLTTDADGHFDVVLCPGSYRAIEWGRTTEHMLFSDPAVLVPAGRDVECTFAIWGGTVRVRLLTAAGEPLRGFAPQFYDAAAPKHLVHDTRTDEAGVAEFELPRGHYAIQLGEPGDDGTTIGEVTITADRTVEVELRVPAEVVADAEARK